MKKALAAFAALALAASLAACSGPAQVNSVKAEQQSAATGLAKLLAAQPVPQYDFSQIRQTLIDAETAQASSVATTSFFFNFGVVDPIFICPSIGFPVPGSDQLTNPSQLIGNNSSDSSYYGVGVVGQVDPNGVYGGPTSATLVLCVGVNGKVTLHHAEESVHALAGPAIWDMKTHRMVSTGDPSFKVTVGHK
jgi:hypothetical protein